MGKSQRNKGAGYEREVAAAFSDALGGDYRRKIGQSRDGGNDLDVGPLCIEIKRRATLGTVYGWLQQAIAAAVTRKEADPFDPAIPVVVARQDSGESIVILRLNDFLVLARDEIAS